MLKREIIQILMGDFMCGNKDKDNKCTECLSEANFSSMHHTHTTRRVIVYVIQNSKVCSKGTRNTLNQKRKLFNQTYIL